MTVNELREYLMRPVFEPFDVHISDGRVVRVVGRDFMLLPPDGIRRDTVAIFQKDGSCTYVDAYHVTGVSFDADQVKLQGAGV
jgi:hypothetical protein